MEKMKTLEEYLKNNLLVKEKLTKTVKEVCEEINTGKNISLELKSIKTDDELTKLEFEISENKQDMKYELSKFLIRILRHCDVNDSSALRKAYKMFVRTSKEDYEISEILDLCKEEN